MHDVFDVYELNHIMLIMYQKQSSTDTPTAGGDNIHANPRGRATRRAVSKDGVSMLTHATVVCHKDSDPADVAFVVSYTLPRRGMGGVLVTHSHKIVRKTSHALP